MRQNFNSGQEVIFQDLNALSGVLERQFYDRILSRILQGKTNAFFDDSFKAIFAGGTSLLLKAGFGLQYDGAASDTEPKNKAMFLETDTNITLNSPDSVNNRIDLVVIKAVRVDLVAEDRKYKDEFSDTISTQNFTVITDSGYEHLIVTGLPSVTPVKPDVPVGYLEIAEILVRAGVGMADQNDISDSRELLPKASATGGTGRLDYDHVVGDIAQIGVTFETLKEAVDNAKAGDRILVLTKQDIDATVQINVANLEIDFKKGTYLEKDGAVTAIQISADDCTISNLRVIDFNGSGDIGILIDAAIKRTIIEKARFSNCDTEVEDNGTETFIPLYFTE